MEPPAHQTLLSIITSAPTGIDPETLYRHPRITTYYESLPELQADLNDLVINGVLRCRESPGTLQYVRNQHTEITD